MRCIAVSDGLPRLRRERLSAGHPPGRASAQDLQGYVPLCAASAGANAAQSFAICLTTIGSHEAEDMLPSDLRSIYSGSPLLPKSKVGKRVAADRQQDTLLAEIRTRLPV